MRHKKITSSLAALFAIVACGTGGTVDRFAPCTTSDTCPSATVCEAVVSTSPSLNQTFCTWSCSDDHIGGQTCPSDANGVKGVCVSTIGNDTIGDEGEFGFCFQDCSASACPSNESCEQVARYAGGTGMACVPIPNDPLAGTSWTSTTLVASATSNGVTSSSYVITFGATSSVLDGLASGAFSATLTLQYDATAFQFAGCTETTTFSGGAWVDVPPTPQSPGVLGIDDMMSTTSRTGCTLSSDDVSGEQDRYDIDTTDSGAGYLLTSTTLSIGGGNGAVPFSDATEWTFTKN